MSKFEKGMRLFWKYNDETSVREAIADLIVFALQMGNEFTEDQLTWAINFFLMLGIAEDEIIQWLKPANLRMAKLLSDEAVSSIAERMIDLPLGDRIFSLKLATIAYHFSEVDDASRPSMRESFLPYLAVELDVTEHVEKVIQEISDELSGAQQTVAA